MKCCTKPITVTIISIALLLIAAWPCAALDYTPVDLGVLPGYVNSVACDINVHGQIAGYAYNEDWAGGDLMTSEARAFLWLPADAYGLPAGLNDLGVLPGFQYAQAFALNNSGQVIGVCWNGDWAYDNRGFIWLPEPAYGLPAGMSDLGVLPGDDRSVPCAINSSGQIVGMSWLGNTMNDKGFFWQNGIMQEFTDLPEGAYGIRPNWGRSALNDAGIVVGLTLGEGSTTRGVIWDFATKKTIAQLPDMCVAAVNESGQVAGYHASSGEFDPYYAFLWLPEPAYGMPAGVNNLGSPEGTMYTTAMDISAGGRILGNTYKFLAETYSYYDAWIWQDGTFTCCMNDPELMNNGGIWDLQMNSLGLVAGAANLATGGSNAFLWNGTSAPQALASLGGDYSYVYEINDPGQVVGQSSVADSEYMHACLWGTSTVTNEAPTLTLPATEFEAVVGTQITFTATATDPDDGDALTFSVVDAPTGAAIGSTTGVFTWTPTSAGTYSFDVRVTDAGGLSDSERVTVDVSALSIAKSGIVHKGNTFIVRVMIGNPNATAAANVTVTAASLGGVATNSLLPQLFGTIKPGASKQCTLQFQGLTPGDATLIVQGSSSRGDFFTTQTVVVP